MKLSSVSSSCTFLHFFPPKLSAAKTRSEGLNLIWEERPPLKGAIKGKSAAGDKSDCMQAIRVCRCCTVGSLTPAPASRQNQPDLHMCKNGLMSQSGCCEPALTPNEPACERDQRRCECEEQQQIFSSTQMEAAFQSGPGLLDLCLFLLRRIWRKSLSWVIKARKK